MCVSVVMSWLHIYFSLLHSAIDCLQGAESTKGESKGHPANLQALDLAISEGAIPKSVYVMK